MPGINSWPSAAEPLDRRRGRGDALPAERERLAALDRPEHRGHLAAGPVQVRLDDLQHEARRDGCIEGVAAALEHRHPGLGREPVRRRDHPEGAAQLRTGGERHAGQPTEGALAPVPVGTCLGTHHEVRVERIVVQQMHVDRREARLREQRTRLLSPHIAPSPSPPWASETVMQCMHEIM